MLSIDGPDYAQIATQIGLTTLRAQYPALTGQGITVGQVEGSSTGTAGGIDFEVDPASLGYPVDNSNHFFSYIRGGSSTFTYNDGLLGSVSNHATVQAGFFYNPVPYLGAPEGVAPGVAHVNNYNADSFLMNLAAFSVPDTVVNLSVVYTGAPGIDAAFDAVANSLNTVFVAAAGNGGTPGMPSSAYNVISVDTFPGIQAIGPAADGVPKPDISAPQTVTSRTTAIVSGAATLLVQAGSDGIGGASAQARTDAVDFRAVKALLLNGATKPADYFSSIYAPTTDRPLNAVYGAGIVNIANAVANLAGGEHGPQASTLVPMGASSFATTTGAALADNGWNLATLTTQSGKDAIHGYGIALTAGIGFAATLTWAADDTNTINHLALYLYDNATGALIASSTSMSSNVQQITATPEHTGRYDLEVVLRGTAGAALSDRYALAYAAPAAIACFAGGTRLLTDRGELAVEALRPCDRAVTLSGRLAPIRFVGRSAADPTRVAGGAATPVRICAGGILPGVPHRDLLLSPDHALALRDAAGLALVPVRLLVNDASIMRGGMQKLTYFHVELDHHDVLLAEGLPVESFRDTGNRGDFDNAADAPPGTPNASPCAPLLLNGPRLAAFHARVTGRLAPAATADDPVPLLRCDGNWLAPSRRRPGFAAFTLPAAARDLRLVSRIARPSWANPATPDHRRLGMPVTRITRDGALLSLASLDGAHDEEADGAARWRWTDGNTALTLAQVARPSVLELWWMKGWARYWTGGGWSE